jgi:hypothetical protein
MTAITPHTELRALNRGSRPLRKADVRPLDATLGASHVQSIKRFCKLILAVALLSVAGVGVVALKSVIWISHFND